MKNKTILGVSAGHHDAAISVIDYDGNILFAGHSERYTGVKNDKDLCREIFDDIDMSSVTDIAYYERPFIKQMRRLYSGEGIQFDSITLNRVLNKHVFSHVSKEKFNPKVKKHCFNHHLSHAAGGFQTSPFNSALCIVIDAIGEFDTVSVWDARYTSGGFAHYQKVYNKKYPQSLGLFYTAITDFVGLKPNEDEYILMGMASYGNIDAARDISERIHTRGLIFDNVQDLEHVRFRMNFHNGIWNEGNGSRLAGLYNILSDAKYTEFDIALFAQMFLEQCVRYIFKYDIPQDLIAAHTNFVFSGGVALNCVLNSQLADMITWNKKRDVNLWIMPNPGDAGSSLGAAALVYGKKLTWKDAYLGHEIIGDYPVEEIIEELLSGKICGVASGKAEFGPRALGNRSLLADPRGDEIKDKVNEIKRRQKFRPFAPVILEEHVNDYFDMPSGWKASPYMQTVAVCKKPDEFPAIVHVDGTSRVQTVPKNESGIRKLLEAWYATTGCPMLLNTSLNIKGMPIVNDEVDAQKFEDFYGVRVFTKKGVRGAVINV